MSENIESNKTVFGDLDSIGLEVVNRSGKLFVRYDAGAHVIAWREDEISATEFDQISKGGKDQIEAMFAIQRRIAANGIDPYKQNWKPVID